MKRPCEIRKVVFSVKLLCIRLICSIRDSETVLNYWQFGMTCYMTHRSTNPTIAKSEQSNKTSKRQKPNLFEERSDELFGYYTSF